MAEYIVTVKKGINWEELHSELKNDTSADSSVDSSIIPDREVPVVKERPINPRNTHYDLTDNEAESLRNDSRVVAVTKFSDITKPVRNLIMDGDFNKSTTDDGQQDNWGLLRHISKTNNYGTSTSDPGGTYDYVLDGTGVDVVIIDDGIQPDHPEWEDKNGTTRLKQINWFTASGVSGTMPANHYTASSTDFHGTHVTGTVAGKTFGWAKNSDIYFINYLSSTNDIGNVDTVWDVLLGWHNNKGTGRPTVVNMSFGFGWFINESTTPHKVQDTEDGSGSNYNIVGGRYRGTTNSDTTRQTSKGQLGQYRGSNVYMFPRRYASVDADIESLLSAGIHIVVSAGNDQMKIDKNGGADFDNYIEFDYAGGGGGYAWYHRGGSPSGYECGDTVTLDTSAPTIDDNGGFQVGALDVTPHNSTTERKVNFSESGPGVDIYAAGTRISSAWETSGGETYYHNSSFKQDKISGTSMASPQIAGMIACLLQAHPDWTPLQIKNYLIDNSQATIRNTGSNNDYTDLNSIHGGTNRVAYFPMSGSKPYNYGG